MSNNNDFWAQEKVCEEQILSGGPYYMISTEDLPWLLFESDDDFLAHVKDTKAIESTRKEITDYESDLKSAKSVLAEAKKKIKGKKM